MKVFSSDKIDWFILLERYTIVAKSYIIHTFATSHHLLSGFSKTFFSIIEHTIQTPIAIPCNKKERKDFIIPFRWR